MPSRPLPAADAPWGAASPPAPVATGQALWSGRLSDTLADSAARPGPPLGQAGVSLADPAPPLTSPWPLLRAALALLCAALVVALLYVGEALLVPFALATLLAFVLDPLVTRLQRWRLPRAVAVVGVMAILAVAVAGASVFVAGQAVALGRDLPTYQSTVQKKLRALRQEMSGRGPLDDVSRMLDVVGSELEATRRALAQGATPAGAPAQRVVMAPVEPTALQALRQLVEPLLGPVGTAGLVLVFLLFILLERHDLRDRLLRLVGGDLHRSTEALGEAGERVSRYLGMQVLVNLGYALPLALGLWLLGVPGALLFGVLGGLLRFVPYIGPLVAAAFPLAMAFAVDPGWQLLLATLGLVLVLELLINNLVEPWLYGASTGLAPTAVVVSAAFWTLLWGPVGLILATPLTVCLVVMGRHLPRLAWLDVLLGSTPVFDPPTRLYQRLLDGEVEEAVELALGHARGHAFQAACNDTMLPVMALVADNQHRLASAEQRLRLVHGLEVVLNELRAHAQQASQHAGEVAEGGAGPAGVHPTASASTAPAQVVCVGVRGEVDALAAQLLAQVLGQHGVAASTLAAGALSAQRIDSWSPGPAQVVVLCSLARRPEAQLRFISRRLRRLHPGLQPVLALWHAGAAPETLGPDLAGLPWARSLDDAVLAVSAALRELGSPAGQEPAADAEAADPTASGAHHSDNPLLDPACQAPLDHAVQRAAEVFDMPMACVALPVAGGQLWLSSVGWPVLGEDEPRLPADLGLLPEVLASGRAIQVADMARHPRLASQPLLVDAGVRGLCAVPLRLPRGGPLGALIVADRRARQLRPPELQLLQRLADDLVADLGVAAPTAPSTSAGQGQHSVLQGEAAGQAADTRPSPSLRGAEGAARGPLGFWPAPHKAAGG